MSTPNQLTANRDHLLAQADECDHLAEARSHTDESLLARAFTRDTDNTAPLPKPYRYLTTTTRRIDRTVRELQKLQNEPITSNEPAPSILTPDSCLLTPDLQNEPISNTNPVPSPLSPDSCLPTPDQQNEPIFHSRSALTTNVMR